MNEQFDGPILATRNAWVENTLALDGIDPDGPVELLGLLYEDFSVSAATFLHPYTLQPLLAAGLLDAELYARCLNIAEKVEYLTQHPELAQDPISQMPGWQEVFALCAEARARKAALPILSA